jgi:hypothetical protein
MEKDKDKDEEPKPVADYWINPRFRRNPGAPRGIVIRAGERGIFTRTGGKPVAKKDDKAN